MNNIQILDQKVNFSGLINSIDIKPNEFLLPLQEVIVNALQSIEDRDQSTNNGKISIIIHQNKQTNIDNSTDYFPIIGFTIIDDGVGFTDNRETAFSTPFTNFNFKKGGKGMGRYTVLACFGSMEIDSCFTENNKVYNRSYKFDSISGLQKYPEDSSDVSFMENKTIIKLNNYKPDYYKYSDSQKTNIEHIANAIIQHCLLFFLNEDKLPLITIKYEDSEDILVLNDIYRRYIEIEDEIENFLVKGVDHPFSLKYIRNYSSVQSHCVHLCANKREVGKKRSLSSYIPSFKELYSDDNQKYHLSIYVESDFLDNINNPQRNRFVIPENSKSKTESDKLSIEDIILAISENVRDTYSQHIEDAEREKNLRIKSYIMNPAKPRLRYRHLLNIPNIFNDIPINATEETIEAKLHEKEFKLEKQRNKEFDKIFKQKNYDKEDFGSIINTVLKEEASFSKDKLADLMIKRKSVLKLFRKYLEWRSDDNFMLESDLHNIVFTMGADSENMPIDYHNLWLLDERFTFHTHTSSDVKTKSVKNLESEGVKESDILIYDMPCAYSDELDKINSLVVFEFKRPGRDIGNSTSFDDLIIKYFKDLMQSKARSSKGKLLNIENNTPKFGYVVCELNKENIKYNTDWHEYKESAHGHLYKIIPSMNLHIEVMSYEQMLDFSEKKHHSFFKALGIDNL